MFSIVVPVYNKRHTLSATIASVLAQSFVDFELIVVDDGSTDGSMSVLDGLADPRLRRLAQRNRGPGAARNAGAEAARHDWIAFLDADDLWADHHLAELDQVRRRHPEAGLIGTSYRMSHSEGLDSLSELSEARIGLVEYFDAVAAGDAVLCASTAAVRRDVWRETRGFGAYPWGQDTELWVRIASRWPVATSRRVTAIYLQGTGGISERRWKGSLGNAPQALADLSPAVMRVLELRLDAPAVQRESYDRFVDIYLHWWLRAAVRDGHIATVRGLRRLYERRPSRMDRFLLAAAALPAPLARALHRAKGQIRSRLPTFGASPLRGR
jgi:glycosyltransferase involved in cell wall biosynthesis